MEQIFISQKYFCQFCDKQCKNKNSYMQHKVRCKLNPDKVNSYFVIYNKLRAQHIVESSNQYIKAKKLGLPKPILSEQTLLKKSKNWLGRKHTQQAKRKISYKAKLRCESVQERNRLEQIGRFGGFGQKGIIHGIRYESRLQKKCYEYLVQNNISFQPHKRILQFSKISDAYLTEYNLWLQFDGINRQKKKKYLGKNYNLWLQKLQLYKNNNLQLSIIYTLEQLKVLINKLV